MTLKDESDFAPNPARNSIATPFMFSGSPDPLNIYWSGDWAACANSWATLVEMDWLGRPVPKLAKSWQVSTNGLVWEFELQNKRFWSDGTPITNVEVVESLKLSMTGTTHSYFKDLIRDIRGANDRITIELEAPLPNLLGHLAFVDWAIFHPSSFKNHNGKWSVSAKAPCSGAFCIEPTDEITAKQVKLSKNRFYTLGSDQKRPEFSAAYLRNYTSCEELLSMTDQLLGFRAYADDLNAECRTQLENKGFSFSEARPAWLQKLDFTKSALEKIPQSTRLKVFAKVALALRSIKFSNETKYATGLRSTHLEASLSEDVFLKLVKEIERENEGSDLPKKLTISTVDQWGRWPTFNAIVAAFAELGINVETQIFDRAEFNKRKANGDLNKSSDLIYVPFGAGDPDPDTSWQFAANNLYPGSIEKNDLKSAFLEIDQAKRMEKYRHFAEILLRKGAFIPLTVTSDIVGIHKNFKFTDSKAIKVGIIFQDYAAK